MEKAHSRKTWQVINEVTSRKSNKLVINELEYGRTKKNQTIQWKLQRPLTNSSPSSTLNCLKQIKDVDIGYYEFVRETNEEFSFGTITQSVL